MHRRPLNLAWGVVPVPKLPKCTSKSLNLLIGSLEVQIIVPLVKLSACDVDEDLTCGAPPPSFSCRRPLLSTAPLLVSPPTPTSAHGGARRPKSREERGAGPRAPPPLRLAAHSSTRPLPTRGGSSQAGPRPPARRHRRLPTPPRVTGGGALLEEAPGRNRGCRWSGAKQGSGAGCGGGAWGAEGQSRAARPRRAHRRETRRSAHRGQRGRGGAAAGKERGGGVPARKEEEEEGMPPTSST